MKPYSHDNACPVGMDEVLERIALAIPSASVTTTNAAPQALQPADHGRGVDEAAQPTVGSREVATTPAGAAPSKSDLAHWLMACHEEREHPVYHDERFRLAAESIQSASESTIEDAARYRWLAEKEAPSLLNIFCEAWDFFGNAEDQLSDWIDEQIHKTDSGVKP